MQHNQGRIDQTETCNHYIKRRTEHANKLGGSGTHMMLASFRPWISYRTPLKDYARSRSFTQFIYISIPGLPVNS